MTILAAAQGPDGVWIGSDGLTTVGGDVADADCRKWLISPDRRWAIGDSGETTYQAAIQALRHRPEGWPNHGGEEGMLEFLGNLTAMLRERGADPKPEEGCIWPEWRWSPILATTTGGADTFHVARACSSLLEVIPPREGWYHAAGCGEVFAVGAMSALLAQGENSAEALVRAAVDTACRCRPDCGGTIRIERLAEPRA